MAKGSVAAQSFMLVYGFDQRHRGHKFYILPSNVNCCVNYVLRCSCCLTDEYGHYMITYLDNSTESAALISPVLPNDREHCQVVFSYAMPTSVALEVYGVFSSGRVRLGVFKGTPEGFYSGLDIGNHTDPFTVEFIATTNNEMPTSGRAYAKVDDINFRECLECESMC